MQIKENRADITARIVAVKNDENIEGASVLTVALLSKKDHGAYPNIVNAGEGEQITLKVKNLDHSILLSAGNLIAVTIRAVPGNIYFANEKSLKIL